MSTPGLIDTYLPQVTRGMARRHSDRIPAEIDDHLRERVEQLITARDRDPLEAEPEALDAFGGSTVIARLFNDEGEAMPTMSTRWSSLCGMLARPMMLLSAAVTPEPTPGPGARDGFPVLLPLVLVLLGFAGLVARTCGAFGRTRGVTISVALVLGIAFSPSSRGGLVAGANVAGSRRGASRPRSR